MAARTPADRLYGQVGVLLAPQTFSTVEGMSKVLKKSRAEIVRDLVDQGLVALRAAAAAQDAGGDVNAAVVDAVAEANKSRDNTVLYLLDALNDYLEHVERRRPRDAYLLASGAATALRGWADQCDERHSIADADRLASQEALAERFVVANDQAGA